MDVFMYAGYARRTSIVKECVIGDTETVSPTMGQKISCMGDEWWGPAWVDASYGVCHTFNPCAGIPMGESCDADSDCTHILNRHVQLQMSNVELFILYTHNFMSLNTESICTLT